MEPGVRKDHLFDVSFMVKDSERRERHGQIWSPEELNRLRNMFAKGAPLELICKIMHRPAAGVVTKLANLRIISYVDPQTYEIHQSYVEMRRMNRMTRKGIAEHEQEYGPDTSQPQIVVQIPQPSTEGETVSIKGPLVVTNQTNLNGRDLATLSDSDLYGIIAEEELRVKELGAISNKPNRLKKEIETRLAGIQKLVDYMNSKDAS